MVHVLIFMCLRIIEYVLSWVLPQRRGKGRILTGLN